MILIYGIPLGETERYTERPLSTQCQTSAEIELLKARAAADGFHSFRVALHVDGTVPDFGAAVAR